jgi:2-hydroxy fatty acid dioxygenase
MLNGPFWLLLVYTSYYVILEPFGGITWGIFQALPTWIFATMFQQNVPWAWAWAIGLHLFSWEVQVRGSLG